MTRPIPSLKGSAMSYIDELIKSLYVMAAMVEARDPYTGGHLWRVSQFSRILAGAHGLPDTDVARYRNKTGDHVYCRSCGGEAEVEHDGGAVRIKPTGRKGSIIDVLMRVAHRECWPSLGVVSIRSTVLATSSLLTWHGGIFHQNREDRLSCCIPVAFRDRRPAAQSKTTLKEKRPWLYPCIRPRCPSMSGNWAVSPAA